MFMHARTCSRGCMLGRRACFSILVCMLVLFLERSYVRGIVAYSKIAMTFFKLSDLVETVCGQESRAIAGRIR